MGMALLLLPGMDGTGKLFRPFIGQVPAEISTNVVSYPTDRIMSYDELLPLVEQHLEPCVPHVVVAESFSGPLAVKYACRRQSDVAALILCGSFLSNPLPRGLRWLPRLAHPVFASLATRGLVLRTFLLDFSTPREQVIEVSRVIRSIDPRVIVARMRAIAAVDVADKLRELRIPILYIKSRRDRVIGTRGASQVRAAAPAAVLRTIDAPHLILQTRPREAADIILEFLHANRVAADSP